MRSDATEDIVEHSIPRVGDVFASRYRIEGTVGKGAMGVVLKARHMATERQVAVKVLWPNVLSSRSAVEMFELEAKVAARVRSQHIVEVLDAGLDEATGLPYLVMELLEGQNLDNVPLPMPARDVVFILGQVALALDKAHAHKDAKGAPAPIIHRDLKPENLFLHETEHGEPLAKILDFGLAKVLSASAAKSMEMKGTPLFMAPEQAEAVGLTPQTDIWSLGLIAFYLLSGEHYWQSARDGQAQLAKLVLEIIAKPMSAPRVRLKEIGLKLELPVAFDSWFQQCANRDPQERFHSAGAAITALGAALGEDSALPANQPRYRRTSDVAQDTSPSTQRAQLSEAELVGAAEPEPVGSSATAEHAAQATVASAALPGTLGPISRTSGKVPVDTKRWALPLVALILAAAGGAVWFSGITQAPFITPATAVSVKADAMTAESAAPQPTVLPPGDNKLAAAASKTQELSDVAGSPAADAGAPAIPAAAQGTPEAEGSTAAGSNNAAEQSAQQRVLPSSKVRPAAGTTGVSPPRRSRSAAPSKRKMYGRRKPRKSKASGLYGHRDR